MSQDILVINGFVSLFYEARPKRLVNYTSFFGSKDSQLLKSKIIKHSEIKEDEEERTLFFFFNLIKFYN